MSDLEQYTEAVAVAQREVYVAGELLSEYQLKVRLADEELSYANRRLDVARHALSNAAITKHLDKHGNPVSSDDRVEFEKRWDARVEADKAKDAAYAADVEARNERIANETRNQLAVAKTMGNIAG